MEFEFDSPRLIANLADEVHGTMLPLKYELGVNLKPGQDPNEAASAIYDKIDQWAKSKGLTIAGSIVETKVINKEKNGNTVTLLGIRACITLKELDSFFKLAAGNEETRKAWDEKYEELNNPTQNFTDGLE